MLTTNQGILLNLNLATLETGQILASDPTGRWVINVWPGDLGIAAQEDLDTAQATADAAGLLATAAKSTADTAVSAIAAHAGSGGAAHAAATSEAAGFMTAAMVVKLAGIASGAQPGTVTSIAIEAPADVFSIEAAPITTAGTFHLTLASQLQGTVLAAPSGGNGTPLFRQLTTADVSGLGTAAALDTGTDAGDVVKVESYNTDDLVAWGAEGLVYTSIQPWMLAKWSNDTDRAMVCDGLSPCLTFQPIAEQPSSVYVLRGLDAAGAQLTWWIDLAGNLGAANHLEPCGTSISVSSGTIATGVKTGAKYLFGPCVLEAVQMGVDAGSISIALRVDGVTIGTYASGSAPYTGLAVDVPAGVVTWEVTACSGCAAAWISCKLRKAVG